MSEAAATSTPTASSSSKPPPIPPPSFPTHNSPRVWFITSSLSPLAVRLIRLLLIHGDYVAAGLPPSEIEDEDRSAEFRELINECKSVRKDREGWKDRIRGIRCDGRLMASAQSSLAEAIETFGRIDILLCNTSEAVVGTVEELSTNPATLDLVRRQFEIIFFSHVNFIKAALPHMRQNTNGHIIILTSIAGHISTPGMSSYCAATWALEGYCDSLAFEVAPFNVKMTIVQPNKEINVLTNKITFAPMLPHYESSVNPFPGLRDILSSVVRLDTEMEDAALPDGAQDFQTAQQNGSDERKTGPAFPPIISRYPKLTSDASDRLVMETVHALTAIGGHENPPMRHIVGGEGERAVKEKLKTVSEELEDFVEISCAVDIFRGETGLGSGGPSQGQGTVGL